MVGALLSLILKEKAKNYGAKGFCLGDPRII